MFFLTTLALCTDYVLPDGIRSIEYELKAGSSTSFFTPNQKFLIAFTRFDEDSAVAYIASPFNAKDQLVNIKTPLFFPSGNSKITVKATKDTVIKLATLSMPSEMSCVDGIKTVVDEYELGKVNMEVNKQNMDTCLFFACDTNEHIYTVTENNLKGKSTMKTYRYKINSNAFDSYTSAGEKNNTISSDNPWFFRLTSTSDSAEKGGKIVIDITANKDSGVNEKYLKKFDGTPKTYTLIESNQYSKWYIPILGSVAPIILLVSFVYTFANLYQKEIVVVDGGLFDDIDEAINN